MIDADIKNITERITMTDAPRAKELQDKPLKGVRQYYDAMLTWGRLRADPRRHKKDTDADKIKWIEEADKNQAISDASRVAMAPLIADGLDLAAYAGQPEAFLRAAMQPINQAKATMEARLQEVAALRAKKASLLAGGAQAVQPVNEAQPTSQPAATATPPPTTQPTSQPDEQRRVFDSVTQLLNAGKDLASPEVTQILDALSDEEVRAILASLKASGYTLKGPR